MSQSIISVTHFIFPFILSDFANFVLFTQVLVQTILLLESLEVGTLTPTLLVAVLLATSIDLLTEISGSWFDWIWLLLFGVWTFGNFTDWFVLRLLLALYWLLRLMMLFDTTILLLPVTNAGFWFGFTAWERFLFFCCSNYFVFSYFASSASLKATVLAIFLICWCLLLRQPKKLKFLEFGFAAFVLL